MTLMAPKAPPMESEPVSPMNTMAGGALNQRKPNPAPQSAPQKVKAPPPGAIKQARQSR